jgi:hypothetical protein
MVTGGSGGITYQAQLVRAFDVMEAREARNAYVHLSMDLEVQELPGDTKTLTLMVAVANPGKEEFSVWENFRVTYKDEVFPYDITHQFYSGELSYFEVTKLLPIKSVKSAEYWMEIKRADGAPTLVIGPVKYIP